MKSLAFLIGVLLSPPLLAQADNELIDRIRTYYAAVNSEISDSERSGREGVLYCSKIVINAHNASWRAVGNYKEEIEFWHSDDPAFVQELMDENPLAVLKKVSIRSATAARKTYEEYLFENGKIVFAFIDDKNGEEPLQQRYYFSDTELIQYRENTRIISDLSGVDSSAVMARVGDIQSRFLAIFQ